MGAEELVIGVIEQGDPEYELVIVEVEVPEEHAFADRPRASGCLDGYLERRRIAPKLPLDIQWVTVYPDAHELCKSQNGVTAWPSACLQLS